MENKIMENKYLTKISSWEKQSSNKYLEKIAGFTNWIGGALKTVRSSGVDGALGSGIRTVQKAFQPLKQTNVADLATKQVTTNSGKVTTGFDGKLLGNIKRDIQNKSLGVTSAERLAKRKATIADLREMTGKVKNGATTTSTTTPEGGTILKRVQHYAEPGNRATQTAYNKYIGHLDTQSRINSAANNRVMNARAKVGLGAAGVVGVGTLAYNRGKNSSQPQYQDIGTMPY